MVKPLVPATRMRGLVAGIKIPKAVQRVVISTVVNEVKRYARFKLKIMLGLAIYSSLLVFAVIIDLKYSMLFWRVTIWAPMIRKFKYTRLISCYRPALNATSYSSGFSKLGCLRSDSKHRLDTLSEPVVRATTIRSSMAAALVNSLFVVQSASVMCLLFCGKALTEFNTDSFGNILWDEVPAKTAEQEYSIEGRVVFCLISFWYLNLLSY